jgi:hypothetical protein
MAIYLRQSQLPELKDIPRDMHDDIVEAAIFSIPISLRNLLLVGLVILPLAATGVWLATVFGNWVQLLYLLLGLPSLWLWFLNAARPRIVQIVQEMNLRGTHCPKQEDT